jgi:MraZ protein
MGVVVVNNRFRSRTEHTLDAKGRLNFPSRFREVLRQLGSETLMLAPWGNHLRAYPVSEWEELETKLLTQGGENQVGDFFRYVVGGVVECVPDKQGRILIPPDLRNHLKMEKDVVVTGMISWVEIWDKETWSAVTKATLENLPAHGANLAKMGIIS